MKLIKKFLSILLFTIILISAYIINSGYNLYSEALKNEPLNEKIELIRNEENYAKTEIIPKTYKEAVVAVEDHRFYNHNGIDIISIGRAAITDIKAMKFVEGGSTLTQQLCKNIYFTQEKSFKRKIAEVFMSFDIEKNYSKEDILELYINTCYYGDGYYSIKEASLGYFDVELNKLSDYQATLLAGIPNAPSVYAPTKNPELAKERQAQVLYAMVKYKYMSQEDANNIIVEQDKY